MSTITGAVHREDDVSAVDAMFGDARTAYRIAMVSLISACAGAGVLAGALLRLVLR